MPNEPHTADDLLPTSEAARILGCDPSTIQRRAKTGALPIASKIPGLRGPYLFRRADVEALAQTERVPA